MTLGIGTEGMGFYQVPLVRSKPVGQALSSFLLLALLLSLEAD